MFELLKTLQLNQWFELLRFNLLLIRLKRIYNYRNNSLEMVTTLLPVEYESVVFILCLSVLFYKQSYIKKQSQFSHNCLHIVKLFYTLILRDSKTLVLHSIIHIILLSVSIHILNVLQPQLQGLLTKSVVSQYNSKNSRSL